MFSPAIEGQLRILRGGKDVTAQSVIRAGDAVIGPWELGISRQLVVARPLIPGEESITYHLYGQQWSSAQLEEPYWLHGAGSFEVKRPISRVEFEAEWELVGTKGKQSVYRKRKPRWMIRDVAKLAPRLRLQLPNKEERELQPGDALHLKREDTFGLWPHLFMDRFIHWVAADSPDLLPLADVLDKPSSLFDDCARGGADPLKITRQGADVTAECLIITGDTVECAWGVTKSNADLCSARQLIPGEQVIAKAPWGQRLDTGAAGGSWELCPISDPTDWRIISAGDMTHRYLFVGYWGEERCFRQKVGTLAKRIVPGMGPLRVQSKEQQAQQETTTLDEGWALVYDGNRGYYTWDPKTADKRGL